MTARFDVSALAITLAEVPVAIRSGEPAAIRALTGSDPPDGLRRWLIADADGQQIGDVCGLTGRLSAGERALLTECWRQLGEASRHAFVESQLRAATLASAGDIVPDGTGPVGVGPPSPVGVGPASRGSIDEESQFAEAQARVVDRLQSASVDAVLVLCDLRRWTAAHPGSAQHLRTMVSVTARQLLGDHDLLAHVEVNRFAIVAEDSRVTARLAHSLGDFARVTGMLAGSTGADTQLLFEQAMAALPDSRREPSHDLRSGAQILFARHGWRPGD